MASFARGALSLPAGCFPRPCLEALCAEVCVCVGRVAANSRDDRFWQEDEIQVQTGVGCRGGTSISSDSFVPALEEGTGVCNT